MVSRETARYRSIQVILSESWSEIERTESRNRDVAELRTHLSFLRLARSNFDSVRRSFSKERSARNQAGHRFEQHARILPVDVVRSPLPSSNRLRTQDDPK